jgi:quinolinate synthase
MTAAERKPPFPWHQRELGALLAAGDAAIDAALGEDGARDDVTSRALFAADLSAIVRFRAKAAGVVAGLPVVERALRRLDPAMHFVAYVEEGEDVRPGDVLAEAQGLASSILAGERTALNFLQRMSGIATATRRIVDAVARTRAVVLDTRKTAPGLRALDKYAVRVGGGLNHRLSLSEFALIKDNHIDAAGGIAAAVQAVRADHAALPIEVEVRTLDELESCLAIELLPDAILLDNMGTSTLRSAVERVGGRTWTEASGHLSLRRAPAVARAGVDALSVGSLTHSVGALDVSLDVTERPWQGERAQRLEEARCLKDMLGSRVLVLAHHYVRDDVSDLADVRGDSLELARAAASSCAHYLVLCGVRFMGETAAALVSGEQRVILPVPDAGCSLADCAQEADARVAWSVISSLGSARPVVYVNSSLDLKALSGEHGGAACTSANAAGVVRRALGQVDRVLFLPDQNLGMQVARKLSLSGSDVAVWTPWAPPPIDALRRAHLILWAGACSVHARFALRHVEDVRARCPEARVVVHPECSPDVCRAADATGSTSEIMRWISAAPAASCWAVGTETRLVRRLAAQHPDKRIQSLADVPPYCPSMSAIRLEDLLATLRRLASGEGEPPRVEIPARLADAVRQGLRRMLESEE